MKFKFFLMLISCSVMNTHAQLITTVVGNGIQGYSGLGGPAVSAEIWNPLSVIEDNNGNLYITGTAMVWKVNTAGIITAVAGNGIGATSSPVNGSVATGSTILAPFGVAVDDEGNVYLADDLVLKVNTSGYINIVGGGGTSTADGIPATDARMSPRDVILDNEGNVYFSDNANRVRKINSSGIVTTIAGTGIGGYSGDGGPATAALLNNPYHMHFDKVGNLYIADGNNVIRKVNSSGIISTIAGNGTGGSSGDGGPATAANLLAPTGVSTDSFGNVYIVDQSYRVRKVNTSGIITTVAGNDTEGYNGDGIPAVHAKLNFPQNVFVKPNGDFYIADHNNVRIRFVTSTLGVNQVNTANRKIKAFPNPTKNEISISGADGADRYMIRNIMGQVLLQGVVNGAIDVGKLPPGNYLLSLFRASEPCGNAVFVKE